MNDLSWLIYLADLSGSLSWGFGFLCVLIVIFTAGLIIFRMCEAEERVKAISSEYGDRFNYYEINEEHSEAVRNAAGKQRDAAKAEAVAAFDLQVKKAFRTFYTGCVLFTFSMLIALALPAKETVYGIAASELGETALNTQTGGKAVQALNAWLDKQINGTVTKTEPENNTTG